MLAYKKIKSWV